MAILEMLIKCGPDPFRHLNDTIAIADAVACCCPWTCDISWLRLAVISGSESEGVRLRDSSPFVPSS